MQAYYQSGTKPDKAIGKDGVGRNRSLIMKIRVRFRSRSGTVVYTCKDLAAGCNGKPVFANTS